MVTRDEFIELLRSALGHLYDTERLRHSPLTSLLSLADQADPASALRNLLVDSIESLKPPEGAPAQSRDWRFYESLFYAYVQQLDQRIVSDQLGLSVRQLRREQRAAYEVLADALWNQIAQEASSVTKPETRVARAQNSAKAADIIEKFAWLRDLPSENPISLREALTESLDLAQPLVSQHDVRVHLDIPDKLPSLAVHPVAMNQILLNLFSVILSHSAHSQIHVTAKSTLWQVKLQIQGASLPDEARPPGGEDAASLELVRQLVAMYGGSLTLPAADSEDLQLELVLPALEQVPILAIDDNADALQLLQRYTAGTRYRLVGTRDPHEALELAQRLAPQAVVLDVMMPQEDGWKVMSMLRQHPYTAHIPVVICTILAQEKLALSLGASAFLQKPVTRQAFLNVLKQQIEATGNP